MMWAHERAQLGAMMIWCHEQVALIFVGGIAGGGLCGGGQALKVKFVRITFAMHFGHYILVIVISVEEKEYILKKYIIQNM